ncbi:MAG TPA: CAP domain-containing protein [Thermoanaerobaculia bacterium]|nr:CAP domain-containing protein [Thermoanaerobaculia bacterium]
MRHLVRGIIVLAFISAPLAQGEGALDETRITLRQEVLRMINVDREKYGLAAVDLDIEASAIADSYCRNQIANGTTGHFTSDGYAPYMRYSFAGGNDGVSENAAAWSANYRFSDRALYEMARRSEAAMINEQAPHDGHRRTILDPFATHVGIGLAWERGEFRLTQEFIRRYVTWSRPLPRAAAIDEPISGVGRPVEGYRVEAISVHHEPIPEMMTARTANAFTSYGLPDKRRDYLPRLRSYAHRRVDGTIQFVREEYSDGRRGDFTVTADGAFKFDVLFREGPGVYTVVVWVSKNGDRTPIAASNISIRVDKPAYSYAGTR